MLEGIICRNAELQWQYNASTNNLKEPQILRKNDSSNIWHASSNPREHANRVVLNFIFSVK